MRFKRGPHENPARGAVTIFLPKSAHAHPNSNNPPGRRDLAAITIAGAGGEQPPARAAAATERLIDRRVQGGKCAGPDVEAVGFIRSLVATAHKRRSKAAHWLPLPRPRQGGRWRKAQSTKHRRPSPSCVRCWKAQVPKNQWFSTPRAAPRRHSKPAWPMNTKARWRVPLASSSADVGAAGTVCSLFWCR